jgi:hypothetical protein
MFMYLRQRLSEEPNELSSIAQPAIAGRSSFPAPSHQPIQRELHSAPAVTLIHSDRYCSETDPKSALSFSPGTVDQGTGESFQLGHANG